MLSICTTLLCAAGVHRVFAWLASISLLGWLWYFIDLHRVRYSSAGAVCFGDVGVYADDSDVYLLDEGQFLKYMIVSQWLVIGLLAFGIASNLIVAVMAKFENTDADSHKAHLASRNRRESQSPHLGAAEDRQGDRLEVGNDDDGADGLRPAGHNS